MPDQRADRRVRRTKRRLKEALFELIDEKGYDRITIREITDRADVGRSTFYSHYDSKEDLLFSGFDDWLLSLAVAADSEGAGRDPGYARHFRFSLPLLEHISSHESFFDALVVRGAGSRVSRRIIELLSDVARRELERSASTRPQAVLRSIERRARARVRDAQAQAVAGAFISIVAWWLESGSAWNVEQVDRVFQATLAGARSTPPETLSRRRGGK